MKVAGLDAALRARLDLEALSADDVTIMRMPGVVEATLGNRAQAITLGNLILVNQSRFPGVIAGEEPELLAHELIHVRQFSEHGWAGFLGRYLTDYARLRLLGVDHRVAYRGIGFEHDAYSEAPLRVRRPT